MLLQRLIILLADMTMKTLLTIVALLLLIGCVTPHEHAPPSRSELRSLLSGQRCIVTEPGFEDSTRWMKRESKIRCELGRWLPNDDASLLVTVEILDTCHAEGFIHHLIAVFDLEPHRLLTSVFHLVADHAQRRILSGEERDVLLYDACKDRSFVDVSYLLRFRPGAVDALPASGQRDPERSDFSLARSGLLSTIREYEWRGDYDKIVLETKKRCRL